MAGKPTVPETVILKIQALCTKGMSPKAIAELVGVSYTTVRKALDPEFAERERERHRKAGAARYAARKNDPDYRAYQAAANTSDRHRERVRANMAKLRAERKTEQGTSDK